MRLCGTFVRIIHKIARPSKYPTASCTPKQAPHLSFLPTHHITYLCWLVAQILLIWSLPLVPGGGVAAVWMGRDPCTARVEISANDYKTTL